MSESAALRLQADVAALRGDVADIKQAIALWPAILTRIETTIAQANDRAAHVIDQNNVLVRWATATDDDAAWPVALAGLSAISDRLARVETNAPHVEAALAALADGQGALREDFAAHDRNVAARVKEAATLPTKAATQSVEEVRRLRPYVFMAAALSVIVVAMHILQAYQAGVFVAWLGG